MGAKNKQGEVLRRAGSSVLYLRIPPQVCVAPSATIRANCPFYLEEEKRNTTYHKDAHDQVDDREDETAVNVTGTSDIVGHDGMLAFDEKQRRETTRKQGTDSIRWRGYIFEIGFYKILNSASLPVQASERLHAGNPSQEPS